MYPFVAKVKYWDIDNKISRMNLLLYANSFSEACGRVEEYCDVEDMHIFCVGDNASMFEVPLDIANAFIAGEGNYEEGVLKNELDS